MRSRTRTWAGVAEVAKVGVNSNVLLGLRMSAIIQI
jgi:hypothetical protein